MQLYTQDGEIGIRMGSRFVSVGSTLFNKETAVPFDDEVTSEFLESVAEAINFDLV